MATNYVATPAQAISYSQVGPNIMQFSFANPTFVVNDKVFLIQIPNFVMHYNFYIDLPQLDSNGAPTLTLDIGDNVVSGSGGVGEAGYFSASTAGRSATAGQNVISPGNWPGNVHSGVPKIYSILNSNVPTAGTSLGVAAAGAPAGIWLTMKIHAAAATATTTGTITGYIEYTLLTSTAGQTNPAL